MPTRRSTRASTPPGRSAASSRSNGRASARPTPLDRILNDLETRVEELAERMLERYLAMIPTYRALTDETLRQVRDVNRRNLVGFIGAMRAQRGPTEEDLAMIRASASKRAREGVPLSALLQAYRLGAQLAWTEARNLIGPEPDRLAAGLDLATALMEWVDEVSGAVAQAYLEEYERLTSDREGARRDFLDGVLGGLLTDDEVLARAEALGLDTTVPCGVAILAIASTNDDDVIRSAQHRLRTMAADLPDADRSLVVARGTETVIIYPASLPDDDMPEQLRAFAERACEAHEFGLRAGIGRARETFTELASSYREASIALSAARSSGSASPVAVYGEMLVEELLLRERGVSRRLARSLLDPLEAYPELRQTLIEYLEHGPSLPSVAKRLFLHPNTVSYRLARIRELTGKDPKTPAGVAELFLALRAWQLIDEPGS